MVAFGAANRRADRLGTALGNHRADGVVANLGTAFGNHLADRVVAGLLTALGFHTANRVVANLLAAFGFHAADGVVAHLLTLFANHGAHGVVADLGPALGHHLADGVGAGLGTALGNHVAHGVVAGLGAALGNHLADLVRHFTSQALGDVLGAADFLGFAGRNPHFLANRLGRALDAFDTACTGAIDALAGRGVKHPSTWFAHRPTNDRSGNFFGHGFPVSTSDLDGLGVLHGLGDGVVLGTDAVFDDLVHDRVVDHASLGLVHRFHHGVVDFASLGFIDRLHDRVVDLTGLLFVHRLLHGVVDDPLFGLVHRLLNGVVDDPLFGLVNRLLNRVIDNTGLGFIDRRHDRVVDLTGLLLDLGNHHRVLYFTALSLRDNASAIDHLILVIRFVPRAVTSLLLLLVYSLADGPHHRVRTGATSGSGPVNDGTLHGNPFTGTFDDSFAGDAFRYDRSATTALIADRAAVGSAGGFSSSGDRQDRQTGNHPQPLHAFLSEVSRTLD